MRQLDLANCTLERLSINFIGDYGSGKTRMLRDAIEHELAQGVDPSRILYACMADDEGYMPLKGLKVPAVELENGKDIDTLIEQYSKEPLHLLCADGMDKLSDMSMVATIGSDRAPRTGSAKENEWNEVHRAFFRRVSKLRKCASYFLAASPADKHTNPVTGDSRVYPDLPGSQASKVVGAFDFTVGVEVQLSSLGKVTRFLRVKPTGDGGGKVVAFKLRQRLVRELREDIQIPEGGGAWAILKAQIAAAMVN